jgi:predicted  nucleic acid-binding Zn-ribbon protein
MNNPCPKCHQQWAQEGPIQPTECPKCGVIFAKFYAAQEQKRRLEAEREAQAKAEVEMKAAREARAAAKAKAKEERQTEAKAASKPPSEDRKVALLSTCPACGGTVAIGAKACPHCGKDDPAPAPKKKPARRLTGLGAVLLIAFLIYSMSPGSNPGGSSTPQPPITAEAKKAAQVAIKLAGYRCDSISYMSRHAFKVGFRVTCNDDRYAYELNDEGGRWVVKLD